MMTLAIFRKIFEYFRVSSDLNSGTSCRSKRHIEPMKITVVVTEQAWTVGEYSMVVAATS